MAAPGPVEYKRQAPVNIGTNIARTSLGQGLLFGFGDEVEAFARALYDERDYSDIVKEVRNEIDVFRQQAPVAAYGSEIIGSLPTALLGGAGLARLGLKGAGKIGAIEGAIYGAGASEGDVTTAEGLQQRVTGAATSAALGGAISKAASKVLPIKSKQAKELQKKGIPLTPGQSFRDGPSIGSTLITALEDLSTSYPGAGAPIQAKRLDTLVQSNKILLQEAIEPLGIKIPKTIKTGREAYEFVDDIISKEYDNIVGKLKLNNTTNLQSKILDSVEDSVLDTKEQKKVLTYVDKYITNKIKDGKLSGQDLKNAQTELRRLNISFVKKGGFEGEIGLQFKTIKQILEDEIDIQNPNANELVKINTVYRNLIPLNDAMQQAVINEGVFTPAQLLRAIRKADSTMRKTGVIKGEAPLQATAETMQNVLGSGFPESGTASRLLAQDIILNPLKAGKLVVPGLASELLMSRPLGMSPTTGLLGALEPIARSTAPFVGSLTSINPTKDFNNTNN